MAKPRPPLTRERVLHAAVRLADESGLDALTMRRLGKELGVEAMSLYNHVANKDDLLDGIADLVIGEFELPPVEDGWETAIRRCATSAHEALLRHPWACSLILGPRVLRMRLRYMDWLLGALRAGAFPPELRYRGYHALDSHILGFTMWQLGHRIPADAPPDFMASFLRDFPFDEHPHLGEHVRQHLEEESPDAALGEFEFGLDLVLDGLERRRGEVEELRVALTVDDFDAAVAFYRDALGLEQIADWSGADGRVVVLSGGRATLELVDEAQAATIDRVEAGGRVSGPVRLALEVADSESVARRLVAAGATEVAPPVTTPWGDRNARVRAPDGMQLTLFTSG